MSIKLKSSFTLAFIALVYTAGAQPSVRDLQQYMQQIRTESYLPLPESIIRDEHNESVLFNVLLPYFSDSTEVMRSKAYYIARRIGGHSKNASVRQWAVKCLVQAIRDKDSGISGNASEALTQFNKENFTAIDKDSIAHYMQTNVAHLDQVIKLVGYLDMRDQQQTLRAIATSGKLITYRWSARLALARLGDQESVNLVLAKLNKATVSDGLIYEIVPDLVYTRQPEIFKFLEGIIKSDQVSCQSSDPDSNKKIICGYRVMEYIASVIENYPISVSDTGELIAADYQVALATVRTWFNQHTTYKILADRY